MSKDRDNTRQKPKVFALRIAALGAPWQQIDANHTGSNLLIASPHATMSEGASATSFFNWILGE